MRDPLARWNAFFLLEGTTKVGKTAVADFEGGFGDVAATGGDEGGGAVDAGAADPEHEGGAGDLGEGAAEVVGAATDGGGEGLELVVLIEVLEEMRFDPLHAFMRGAFGAGEEIGGLYLRVCAGGKKFAQEKVGEAGVVHEGTGGVAEGGAQEIAGPGEVVLCEPPAWKDEGGIGF